MDLYPEKPKRTIIEPIVRQRPYMRWFGLLLALLFGLPIPVLLLLRYDQEGTTDMLWMGVMICSALYILYQGMLWLLAQLGDDSDITETSDF